MLFKTPAAAAPAAAISLPITSTLAAAVAILTVRLAMLVIKARQQHKVPHGDGGVPILARRIRGHGNLTENAPLVILLVGLVEAQAALPPPVLAAVAAAFFGGRLAHAYNMTEIGRPFGPRKAGIVALFYTYWALAGALAVHVVRGVVGK